MPKSPGSGIAAIAGAWGLLAFGLPPVVSTQVGAGTPVRVEGLTLRLSHADGQPVRGATLDDIGVTIGGTPTRVRALREAGPNDRRLIAVAIDEDTLPRGGAAHNRLRILLVDLLAAARPTDDISLLGRLRAPMPEHSGFTRDHASLAAAVDRVVSLQRRQAVVAADERGDRNRLARQTLSDLAAGMAGSPHDHRVMVVIGGDPDVDDLDGVLQAGVALYVVDLTESDVGGTARALLDDAARFYVAEIDPVDAPDGSAIQVTTTDPAWSAIALPSLVASPAGSPAEVVARRLHRAVRFGVPHDGLGITATATPLGRGAGGAIRTSIDIDARPPAAAPFGALAHVHVIAFGPDDAVLRIAGVNTAASADGLEWHGELDFPADTVRIGIGVGRSEDRAIGTASTRVEMPDFSAPVTMSGIVVGWPDRGDAPDRSRLPFVPTVARAFPSADLPAVHARVFWRTSRVEDVSLSVSIVGSNGDRVATRTDRLEPPSDATGDAREAEVSFPLPSGLPRGTYELRLTATASGAGEAVNRTLRFSVQ